MLLEAKNLAVRYQNGALGIIDVSVTIDTGGIVSLIGPNGAGKTTTVRALSGFLRTEGAKLIHGSVTFAGTRVEGWEPHRLARAGIAAVPERNKVFRNLSVQEHLASAGLHRGRAQRLAARDLALDLFPVIGQRLRQSAGQLSGGQQQMLAISRALVGCPQLLIVDEMTLGLHVSLQPVLFAAMKSIAATGTACLIVDESTGYALSTANHCYFIEAGTIVRHGAPEELAGSDVIGAGFVTTDE